MEDTLSVIENNIKEFEDESILIHIILRLVLVSVPSSSI